MIIYEIKFYNLNENDDDDQKYSKTKNNILIEQMDSSANKVAGNILKRQVHMITFGPLFVEIIKVFAIIETNIQYQMQLNYIVMQCLT